MKKRIIAMAMAAAIVFAGCGDETTVVEDYPIEGEKSVAESTEKVKEEGSEEVTETKKSNKLTYEITDSKGNVKYKVNADVIGDESDKYAVAKIDYAEFTDDLVNEFVDAIFDEGSVSVIMPHTIADINYVNDRIEVMEARKQSYANEDEVPRYIGIELEKLERLRDENRFKDGQKIECPDKPTVISLNDYYANKGKNYGDVNFCYVEGTINGEFFRLDFITFINNRTIRLYRLQSNPDYGEMYALAENESYLPPDTEGDVLDKETVLNEFNNYIAGLVGADLVTTDVYPLRIVGDYDYTKMLYQKPGYGCFASTEFDGRTFPNTELTSFCSFNTSTNLMVDPQDIADLDQYEDYWVGSSTMETETGSGVYYNGYQSVFGAFDSKGLVEMYISNLMANAGQHFEYRQDVPKITFEEADERAQKYMYYMTEHKQGSYTSEYNSQEVFRVELGMCRVVTEGNYYVVPAWYYLQKSNTMNVLPEPIVVVNAIDGSIIDLSRGGITVDF